MKAFWITNFIWIQIAIAQMNSPLPSGYGFRQSFPPNNLPVNQLPLNNGVPLSNAINRLPIGNIPLNQAPNFVPNLPINNLPNGLPGNLQFNNGLQNLPLANRLPLPQQNLPVNYGNLLPGLSTIQNNYRNLPISNLPNNLPLNNLPINNFALNNFPINNVPVNNIPINNLPIGSNYQINNLPVSNNLPVNNLQLPNNLNALINNYASTVPQNRLQIANFSPRNNLPTNIQLINSLPANNFQIPNNLQIPLTNNAQLLNNIPVSNLPLGYNMISANYLLNDQISNSLPSINYNLPNNLPIVNYNVPANSNYLANNLQSSNRFNNLQLVLPTNNANNLYNGQIGNVQNIPNNFIANARQALPPASVGPQYLPMGQNLQNLVTNPTNVNFGNDCGCKANAVFLLDDKVANTLPSTPALSLNGLQLGNLGKLPLFNGLPVIGMTESIVNLNSI